MLSRRLRRSGAVSLLVALSVVAIFAGRAGADPFAADVPELAADVALPRWEQARAALVRDAARLEACLADAGACEAAAHRRWRALVRDLDGRARTAQLRAVNRFVNRTPYAADGAAQGVRDHWAGPWAFLAGAGDCEDYAIAKYATLKQLGVPVRDMRIVVVEDVVRDLAHAVLAVRAGGRTWLLDNQTDGLVDAARDRRYAPYYAVNDERRWLYRLPARGTAAR